MVLKGIRGFRGDFIEHIQTRHAASGSQEQPVPCVAQCPAGVDIPGYIALIRSGQVRRRGAADPQRTTRCPATCGLICEHPCEVRCRRTMVDDPINIRGTQAALPWSTSGESPCLRSRCGLRARRLPSSAAAPGALSAAYYLALWPAMR